MRWNVYRMAGERQRGCLAMMAPLTTADLGPFWEIAKGILLFAITGLLSVVAKGFWSMRDIVADHERALYGRNGENGIIRGLKATNNRVDVIDERFIAIDAVAAAELAQHQGPERRHGAVRTLAELIKHEIEDQRRRE